MNVLPLDLSLQQPSLAVECICIRLVCSEKEWGKKCFLWPSDWHQRQTETCTWGPGAQAGSPIRSKQRWMPEKQELSPCNRWATSEGCLWLHVHQCVICMHTAQWPMHACTCPCCTVSMRVCVVLTRCCAAVCREH